MNRHMADLPGGGLRDPQALSSALAKLRSLQPRTFRSLKTVDSLVSVTNYYVDLASYSTAQLVSARQHTLIYLTGSKLATLSITD